MRYTFEAHAEERHVDHAKGSDDPCIVGAYRQNVRVEREYKDGRRGDEGVEEVGLAGDHLPDAPSLHLELREDVQRHRGGATSKNATAKKVVEVVAP